MLHYVDHEHTKLSRVILRGKKTECPSSPTVCLHKTVSVNELLLQFQMGNYPPAHPPTPSLLPPCDILSAHSTTRSLQIPFPWIEFSHNCLVADFAFVRGGNFNKGYINTDSRNIKSACLIFCRSPLVTPRQLRPVEAWTQGLWGCPVVSGTRMLEGGSSGWEMGPFMGLTSSGATCGCSMGLRSGEFGGSVSTSSRYCHGVFGLLWYLFVGDTGGFTSPVSGLNVVANQCVYSIYPC